jgi:hypothetical protein
MKRTPLNLAYKVLSSAGECTEFFEEWFFPSPFILINARVINE